ncbi:MAG TPA: hypothetical protein VFR31_07245 [Thermoanaerobaculia bacterium]|nr:hypothetical protein [Thermoanaerobaculia bacterium]
MAGIEDLLNGRKFQVTGRVPNGMAAYLPGKSAQFQFKKEKGCWCMTVGKAKRFGGFVSRNGRLELKLGKNQILAIEVRKAGKEVGLVAWLISNNKSMQSTWGAESGSGGGSGTGSGGGSGGSGNTYPASEAA